MNCTISRSKEYLLGLAQSLSSTVPLFSNSDALFLPKEIYFKIFLEAVFPLAQDPGVAAVNTLENQFLLLTVKVEQEFHKESEPTFLLLILIFFFFFLSFLLTQVSMHGVKIEQTLSQRS